MNNLSIRSILIFLLVHSCTHNSFSQGMNAHWLLGYDIGLFDTNVVSRKAIFHFDSLSYTLDSANFKMPFRAAQSNLSDENGNLLMVSNGCWIADATGDTMMNGGGLIPNSFSSSWCTTISGIPFPQDVVFIPAPGDSNKVILFHQSGSTGSLNSDGVYMTTIDKNLNGGLGGVLPGQKNINVFPGDLIGGMAACKHANGRDWWLIVLQYASDTLFTFLIDPTGFSFHHAQSLGVGYMNGTGQINFSPDGKRLGQMYYDFNGPGGSTLFYTRIFDFNRCSGFFSNGLNISFPETDLGLGMSFSSDSKKLYTSSFSRIYQFNLDTSNIAASFDTVAVNDGYAFPYPVLKTDFWLMTLAANGKIYISSGNGVIDMHYINYPDSNGVACDVQQHAIRLPCYSVRANVYHPNYYLGCDTTLGCPCLITTGLNEFNRHDFKVKLSPNPGKYGFEILYLLPQNKNGMLSIFDLQGRLMHQQILPPWSTMQSIPASSWASGIYQVRIESDGESGTWKWVKY